MTIRLMLQRFLLILGAVALIVLIVEIALAIAATTHGNTPARVVRTTAGPYPLTIELYKDPANAGFALPFSIAAPASSGQLHYSVTSLPGEGVSATPIRASVTDLASNAQGTAEITVQGPWSLHVVVSGPAGQGAADIPITATAPPAIPSWLGWLVGFLPIYGLLIFLLFLRKRNNPQLASAKA